MSTSTPASKTKYISLIEYLTYIVQSIWYILSKHASTEWQIKCHKISSLREKKNLFCMIFSLFNNNVVFSLHNGKSHNLIEVHYYIMIILPKVWITDMTLHSSSKNNSIHSYQHWFNFYTITLFNHSFICTGLLWSLSAVRKNRKLQYRISLIWCQESVCVKC